MPNKHLGQNFLINEKALEDLLIASELSSSDTVVEVGGGLGTITRELAKHAGRVVVVEKDKLLVPILQEQTKEFPNVEVVEGDILQFSTTSLSPAPPYYKLVGAPPYYLTARLFRKFLDEEKVRPTRVAFIIQKEVAQKICARPPDMNLLALSVQVYGRPKIIREVSRGCFWPQPNVDSALLTVDVFETPRIEENLLPRFFEIVKAGFSSPRKQLQNNLQKIFGEKTATTLAEAGIEPSRRAETLSLEEWKKLVQQP